ncbi:MAG: helix-turn-helix domain-containing protein [Desulfovibrio sp.]|nr:helix-turn-helix domain-containing protein [Desulfovibrio sp.]
MAEFLTTTQAAEIVGVKVRAIQAAISSGRLPAVKMGRDWMLAKTDVEAFAASERKPGPKKKERDGTAGFAQESPDFRRGRMSVDNNGGPPEPNMREK